jgi:hypothetical protein
MKCGVGMGVAVVLQEDLKPTMLTVEDHVNVLIHTLHHGGVLMYGLCKHPDAARRIGLMKLGTARCAEKDAEYTTERFDLASTGTSRRGKKRMGFWILI